MISVEFVFYKLDTENKPCRNEAACCQANLLIRPSEVRELITSLFKIYGKSKTLQAIYSSPPIEMKTRTRLFPFYSESSESLLAGLQPFETHIFHPVHFRNLVEKYLASCKADKKTDVRAVADFMDYLRKAPSPVAGSSFDSTAFESLSVLSEV